MSNPLDPRSIPAMVNIATKPVIILGNGPQIDRLTSSFWDRLNAIREQADSELVVAGVNRIGIADACLKNRYKPDIIATVDGPRMRVRTVKDASAAQVARSEARKVEEREMRKIKTVSPKAYEVWESNRDRLQEMEDREAVTKLGGKVEHVPTPTTDAFARSMATCAGVSTRVVSPQATWFLQPTVLQSDIVLNMDTSLTGPADRARMLFTTADWMVNWFARIGCREFYFYGVSMRDGRHCSTLGLVEDDDYSWTEPKRQAICFRAWEVLKEGFPGLHLHNCDRHSLFVEKGTMDFQLPPQLDPNYRLLSDAETTAKRDMVLEVASREIVPRVVASMQAAKEAEELRKLRDQMEADKLRVAV